MGLQHLDELINRLIETDQARGGAAVCGVSRSDPASRDRLT